MKNEIKIRVEDDRYPQYGYRSFSVIVYQEVNGEEVILKEESYHLVDVKPV